MNLRYEQLSVDNLKIAAKVQLEIFPNSSAYIKYKEEVFSNNNLPIDYLVFLEDNPIGVVGLYVIEEYSDTIWISWFGILEKYRNKGIGKQVFQFIIEKAKTYNKKFLRLYTYEVWNSTAQPFYNKYMEISEYYTNELDNEVDINIGKSKIYGLSLRDEPVGLWNNKFIDLGKDDILHEKSLSLMKKDNV